MSLRRVLAAAFALASIVPSRASAAEPTKEACIDADENAQRAKLHGRLLDARDLLYLCAQSACPGPIRVECTGWLAEVQASIPTVVVEAIDPEGRFVTDARVTVDEVVAGARQLDGRAFAVDPGRHRFRVVRGDGLAVSEEATILEGERNRKVTVRFPARAPASSATDTTTEAREPGRPFPWVVVPFAAVAAVGVASFAFFGLRGRAQEDDLRSTCGSRCSDDDARAVETKYLAADVSLLVGVVALGVGTFFFVRDQRAR